jgi:CRISPR-associated protein Cas2
VSGRVRHLLVTYDVGTAPAAGEKRLRRVAQLCCAHGVRVQKSVFECLLAPSDLDVLVEKLLKVMDAKKDTAGEDVAYVFS